MKKVVCNVCHRELPEVCFSSAGEGRLHRECRDCKREIDAAKTSARRVARMSREPASILSSHYYKWAARGKD